jgi:multiple sugar transport system ATP-binding protein
LARVRLKSLTKRFGDVVAVNDVSLEVEDKEFLVLLGPSGCGKTTTLRCVAGLETPDEGEIYIGDTLVNELPPKDRDVAMVFQSYALYPHMKVFDNIAFPLKMRKVPRNEIEGRVKRVAELLRITNLLDRKPKQLSGGEAQRVALGRAIVRDPRVFLMDEPLSNLDAKLRIYMRAELKRLQKDLGVTTVYVTHDQVEAMTMAERIAIMNYGVLQQLATPDKVYDSPQSLFVAGFIGSPPMNFIDCTFMEKDGECFIDAGVFTLPIPDTIGHAVKQQATSSKLILGVRPEDILVHKKRVPVANVEGEVYVLEPLGSEIVLDLKVGDNLIKAKTPPDFRANTGDSVWLSFDINRVHVFDKKTEKAII